MPSSARTPTCALIIGHTPDAPGAVSVGGVSEWDYNRPLADTIVALCAGVPVVLVERGRPNDYSGLPARVNKTGADFAISLHFNAAASPKAEGTEVLYWQGSKEGQRLAGIVKQEIVRALKLPDRGLKPLTKASRGGLLLQKTAMPCVIAEPFFGSNANDWERAKSRKDALALAYAAAIHAYAGVPFDTSGPAVFSPPPGRFPLPVDAPSGSSPFPTQVPEASSAPPFRPVVDTLPPEYVEPQTFAEWLKETSSRIRAKMFGGAV